MQDYTYYNDGVNSATAERLLDINRRFYIERGRDFSETRLRVQPGVRRTLEALRGDESILDLGCGNGGFARELSRHGHRGQYLGLDSSVPLLEDARRGTYAFPVAFVQADLVSVAHVRSVVDRAAAALSSDDSNPLKAERWPVKPERWNFITAFAFMHHVPGRERRLAVLAQVRGMLTRDGLFVLSNWQFSTNMRMQYRIQPWSNVGLGAQELDEGDYLLDWQRGGSAFRYVHEFQEGELAELAARSGFAVVNAFHSDGSDRRSGLYQVWRPA